MSVARSRCLVTLLMGALACVAGWAALTPAAGATTPPRWRWPLPGPPHVVRLFEPPPTPYSAGHRGVDLAAPVGSPVLAAGDGVVSYAGLVAGVPVVSVQHPDGLRTTYEPVAALLSVGTPVHAGDVVGRLRPGHGRCASRLACLHWGLLRGRTYLDPLTLVAAGPVRLLPGIRSEARVSASRHVATARPARSGASAVAASSGTTRRTAAAPRAAGVGRGPLAAGMASRAGAAGVGATVLLVRRRRVGATRWS